MLFISHFSFWSRDKADKMAASIESYLQKYKRPYLLNRSTDSHKICCKMFVFVNPFF